MGLYRVTPGESTTLCIIPMLKSLAAILESSCHIYFNEIETHRTKYIYIYILLIYSRFFLIILSTGSSIIIFKKTYHNIFNDNKWNFKTIVQFRDLPICNFQKIFINQLQRYYQQAKLLILSLHHLTKCNLLSIVKKVSCIIISLCRAAQILGAIRL